jgi:hypothetical protein
MRFLPVQYDILSGEFKPADFDSRCEGDDGATYVITDLSPLDFIPADKSKDSKN